MSDLLNMTERTSERIASLEAQIEELRLLMLKNMENDNSFLSENVEPIPIGSGGGGGNKKPFDYVTEKETEGGVEKDVYKIVRCYFYFEGTDTTIQGGETFTLSSKPNGFVYLRGQRSAEGTAFMWDIGTSTIDPPSGGEAYNFKIYKFNDGSVECDYRDTFMNITLGAHWR